MSNSKNFMITVKNKDTGKEYHIDVTNKTTSYQIKQKLEKENPYLKAEWQMLFDKKDLRINTKTIQDTVESMKLFPDSTILLQLNIPKSELTKIKQEHKEFRESWNISLGYDNAAGLDDYILLIEAISDIAKIDDKDEKGRTILQYAVKENIHDIAHIALEEGANPNQTCSGGKPVLITAIANGSVSIVKLLIEFGVNIHLNGRFGKATLSPLQIAQNYLQMSTDYHRIRKLPYSRNSFKSQEYSQSYKNSYEYQTYVDIGAPAPEEYQSIIDLLDK
jgi:ankyrin repeat protein